MSLKLTVGSTVPIEIQFQDENGKAEDLSDVSRAVFTVKENHDSASDVLKLDTDAANLDLSQKASGKLIGNLTSVQAAALTPGIFVGECNLFFLTPGDWQPSERFYVEVEPVTADPLP